MLQNTGSTMYVVQSLKCQDYRKIEQLPEFGCSNETRTEESGHTSLTITL